MQADHVVHPNHPAPHPTPKPPTPKRVAAHADHPLGKPPGLEAPDPLPAKTPPDKNLHPQGVEEEPSAPKCSPKTSDLKKLSTTNAKGIEVKPTRVLDGTNGKVAVIGRSMDDAVNPMAEELSSKGYEVETFTGDQIPDSAKLDWENLKAKYAPDWIPDDAVKSSEMFSANQAWADKLKAQGYTVVDVGNPMNQGSSQFFDMEKSTIFGDKP